MNWTSGKRQRSKKAIQNPAKRQQQQFFARQRQRSSRETFSPPALAHFDASQSYLVSKSTLDQPRPNKTRSRSNLPQTRQTTSSPGHEKLTTQPELLDPLENVRNRLLKTKDWSSMSALRPSAIQFTSAAEMDSIARPRKISTKHQKRTMPSPRNGGRDLRAMQQQQNRPKSQRGTVSIRTGSNLHQTHTTPKSSRISLLPHDASQQAKSQLDQRVVTAEAGRMSTGTHPGEPRLVPLEQALDLTSFDEVKQRSSSGVRHSSTASSNRFHRGRVSQRSISSLHMGNQEQTASSPSLPRLPARLHSNIRRPLSPSYARGSGDESVLTEPSPAPARSSVRAAPALTLAERRYSHRLQRDDDHQSNRPRFTIDDQVLLEIQTRDNHVADARLGDQRRSSDGAPYNSDATVSHREGPLSAYVLRSESSGFCRVPLDLHGSQTESHQEPSRKRIKLGHVSDAFLNAGRKPNGSPPTDRAGTIPHHQSQPGASRREKFMHAKYLHPESEEKAPALPESSRDLNGSVSDENEAWMKYVFPKDFDHIRNSFNFSPDVRKSKATSDMLLWPVQRMPLQHSIGSHKSIERGNATDQSPMTFRSNVNTSLYRPATQLADVHRRSSLASDTDFLSRLSPMEGILDERLKPISLYANPTVNGQSFNPQPEDHTSARWEDASERSALWTAGGADARGRLRQSSPFQIPRQRLWNTPISFTR